MSAKVPVAAGVHLYPVRHHSPRTSLVLRRFLDKVRPQLVLVEGPEDAGPLIEALVDPETEPPVAILGYRTDGVPGASLWPFAAYSPELVALAWAKEAGAQARFIDITVGQNLALDHDDGELCELGETPRSVGEEAASQVGLRSFEELWEALYEAPDYDEPAFRAALLAYADIVRHEGRAELHRARDAHMARRINEATATVAPERIVVVLGAAHVAALVAGDVDDTHLPMIAESVATTTTLVPFSFPRLAEQTGYGAGNRAPQFYQRAWEAGGSYRRAALEVLVGFSEHLRQRGFAASLADTIEAYRLACTLADIRGKGEPGLDEIREATVATLCRGDATHVDGFLWSSVVGRAVGRVASRIGRSSLQEEFWREVQTRRLPRSDEPEDFVLKLTEPVQVATSVFLHRLRIADIPYATYRGATARRSGDDEAGGLAALTRVREEWQAQWTPATEVALVERIVLGDDLAQVCRRVLAERLTAATTTAAAAAVLLESVVGSIPETVSTALPACDRLAASDDDLPSLAAACRALSGLVSYGSSRSLVEFGAAAIPALCVKTFDRAILRVPAACDGDDDAVAPVASALRVLHELALGQPLVDRTAWIEVARFLAHDYTVHPRCAGLAAGLLYLAQELAEEQLANLVGQRLSDRHEPARAAAFLTGFFEVNALVLVKSRPIVAALDTFLVAIDRANFRDTLPVLRRAFASLGPTERRYLVENIVALRQLGRHAQIAAKAIEAKDLAQLEAISGDLAAAMDDLDDLL